MKDIKVKGSKAEVDNSHSDNDWTSNCSPCIACTNQKETLHMAAGAVLLC